MAGDRIDEETVDGTPIGTTSGRDWERLSTERLGDFRVFSVHRDLRRHPRREAPYPYFRIDAPDWVNVIALTPSREVVLIRQFRAGIGAETLEIPGGMVDGDESPIAAAVRELREETGYVGEAAEVLSWVHPNPALFDNRCTTVLVHNARPSAPLDLDPGEVIEHETAAIDSVPELIRSGHITHALVVTAFHAFFDRELSPAKREGPESVEPNSAGPDHTGEEAE